MGGIAVPPPVSVAEVQSMLDAQVPQPATAVPPGVADAGVKGTSPRFALSDHTHASKTRKAIVAVSTATYTWTYPVAFGAGVVPICNAIAQTAPGATDLINVQIDGVPTNTQCTFRITRYQQSVAALLGLTVLSLNGAPASVNLHMTAFEV